MSDTFYLSREQDDKRLRNLNTEYRELREKIKDAEGSRIVSEFQARKSSERKEFLTHLAILIGGPIASIYFLSSFWAGVASLAAVIIGCWLIKESGSPLEIEDFDCQFFTHFDDWADLERRRLDRDYDRKNWAEKNVPDYDYQSKVSIDHEEYMENFSPARPWDRSWLH